MATFSGKDYTSFKNINLKGNGGAAPSLRNDSEGGYAINLPQKAGTFPIMGTFTVQFPVITSTSNVYSTVVTVSGIRSEDALVVMLNKGNHASRDVFAVGSGSTARILNAVSPGDGQITMGFFNNGLTTGYTELIYSYLAMRNEI